MPPIAIVDSTDSSLTPGIAARHGIRQAPLTLHFGALATLKYLAPVGAP